MHIIYNIVITLVKFLLPILAIFNPKLKLFVQGRKSTYAKLNRRSSTKQTIWFHCASLGEFEQGRPIMEACKQTFPQYQIVLTFFSPSGYEIRKNYAGADVVVYLPLDTKHQAKKFIETINPVMAVFIKYEFWPNYLAELKSQKIRTILISGIFRPAQPFFKGYGKWMRASLHAFDHFFLQNQFSKELLLSIGFDQSTVSGDSRFDRVFAITQEKFHLDTIVAFKAANPLLIAGSTWPNDDDLVVSYINRTTNKALKFIIAPHTINAANIEKLMNRIQRKVGLFSDKQLDFASCEVLIIDHIGLLSKLYKYADVAYVGGGFGTGIHNVLEPATFGVPILIGPTYQKFNEAVELVQLGACIVVKNDADFQSSMNLLFNSPSELTEKGKLAANYVKSHVGATDLVMTYLRRVL